MSEIPPGTMIEVTTELIAEGRLLRQMNAAIREAHAALERRREEGVTSGACTITASISIGYDPDMRDTVAITHCVTLKTPKNEETSLAKAKAGVLMCQPTGADGGDPEQQRLFDAQGRPIGTLNPRTGEITDTSEVVGKVGAR